MSDDDKVCRTCGTALDDIEEDTEEKEDED